MSFRGFITQEICVQTDIILTKYTLPLILKVTVLRFWYFVELLFYAD